MARRKAQDRVARMVWIEGDEFVLDPIGPNRLAADATIATLRELGRIEPVDEAMTVAFVLLADAVDGDPTNAALWGQYRAAEVALRGLGADGDDDALAEFLESLSPEVRDS